MTRPPAIKKRTSSGGVIFRPDTSDSKHPGYNSEVALVAVKDRKIWCLPKGIIDKGEDPPTAAQREVREETGLTGEIIDKIGPVSYWYFLREDRVRIHKTVHFYLLKYIEGSTDDHDHEVDEAKWFLIDEAVNQLSYKSEKDIMRKAQGMIEKILKS